MASSESSIHSFVVRLWLEMPAGEAADAQWRGRIIHVASGAHRYFDDLQEMQDFIRQYQAAALPPNRPAAPTQAPLAAGRWRRWWRKPG
jgi:hypothetical protein